MHLIHLGSLIGLAACGTSIERTAEVKAHGKWDAMNGQRSREWSYHQRSPAEHWGYVEGWREGRSLMPPEEPRRPLYEETDMENGIRYSRSLRVF